MDIWGNVILALGGLALLLFGIKMVSTGLQVVAGDQLQAILKKATTNRFLGAIVGIIATIAINSSTAVSIIVVGFVNAGLMNLQQAIGVMMGINVGTTFSAQLVAFRIDQYAPIFMFLGVILYMFFKKRIVKNIGYAVLGFGILFFSITVMSDALRVFRTMPEFTYLIESISNPILALLAGFLFTILVQSSSATMAILVTMNMDPGIYIPFQTSAFIIFGANIGTSTTALIAAIPSSRDSRRTALFHITYSFLGSVIFGALILLIPAVMTWFQVTWPDAARQVAMFHTLFNVATLVVLIPFVTPLAKLMQTVIPVRPKEVITAHERKMLYLDDQSMKSPMIAVMHAHMEVCRMWEIANENLELSLEAFFQRNTDKAERVLENEKTVDYLYQNITLVLAKITSLQLSKTDTKRVSDMFVVLSEIEQIGDRAENVAEYTIEVAESGIELSPSALEELRIISNLTKSLMARALSAYEKQETDDLPRIKSLEGEVDAMVSTFTQNHFKRLKEQRCKSKGGVIFTDTLSDLEKCADSAEKIAFFVE
jgi:phosphate:Na+ symporter